MPLPNRVILASAGSGKTTTIIGEACGQAGPSALITYTINGRDELCRSAYEAGGCIPPQVTISTWYSFILRHFVRPYQNCMYEPRVSRIQFVNGRSARGIAARDISRHYFSEPGVIYLDKISKFACEVIRLTDGRPLRRFEQIFHYLFLDECQDLAGADLDLIRHLLSSRTQIILVGDHRQATFATNNAARNARYRGTNVIDKFEEWRAEGLCAIECANHSHRCVQPICDFADQFFPDFPKTVSRNERQTDHDGVVAVERRNVDAYMARFSPQCLRYNKTTLDTARKPINFGAAKGLTFERTLIYPHGPLRQFLQTGQVADAGAELSKIYVAVTRARQSVAFVVDNGARLANLELFQPQ